MHAHQVVAPVLRWLRWFAMVAALTYIMWSSWSGGIPILDPIPRPFLNPHPPPHLSLRETPTHSDLLASTLLPHIHGDLTHPSSSSSSSTFISFPTHCHSHSGKGHDEDHAPPPGGGDCVAVRRRPMGPSGQLPSRARSTAQQHSREANYHFGDLSPRIYRLRMLPRRGRYTAVCFLDYFVQHDHRNVSRLLRLRGLLRCWS
jgi:hypothetical protein